MDNRNILKYTIDTLKNEGVDKSQTTLTKTKKYELNVAAGEISLLRTTFNNNLFIKAIKDNKEGKLTINKLDEKSLDEGVKNVIELAETSNTDDSFDIASFQEPKEFHCGDMEPDLDRMYEALDKFTNDCKKLFPKTIIEQMILSFERKDKYVMNSNGVDFKSSRGLYDFEVMFSSKDEEKSSSFNYTGCSMEKIDRDLIDYGTVKTLLDNSFKEINTKPVKGKFTGDIIITPDCLKDMIRSYINSFLGDNGLVSGSSVLKDKLNEKVASSDFTLNLSPVSEEISNKSFITSDGFKSENQTVIDKGILKTFVLSQYGSNKTGHKKSNNTSDNYVVNGGDKSLDDIIKNVDKGILFSRFSGGRPSSDGDFSGVAKNSFYIENGEIKYPISETMVSGNLLDMFNNIKGISKERINFGESILPWICSSGVTISGK